MFRTFGLNLSSQWLLIICGQQFGLVVLGMLYSVHIKYKLKFRDSEYLASECLNYNHRAEEKNNNF